MDAEETRRLIEKIRTININRRRFLQGAAAAAGTAAMVPILNACGGTSSNPTAAPSGGTAVPGGATATTGAAAGTPKRGGTLKVGYETDPTGFNLMVIDTFSSELMLEHVYEPLIEYDEQLKMQPGLAESWEVADDNLSITFHLRKGVKFHNGSDFTADDVEWTVMTTKDPKNGSPHAAYFANVDRIEKPDPYTAKFILSKETGPIMAFFAAPLCGIMSKAAADAKTDFATTTVGTGPFKLVSFEPKKVVKLVKNENYWRMGADGKPLPYLDGIDAMMLSDATARTNALQTKAVDALQNLPFKDGKTLEATTGIVMTKFKDSCSWQYTALNCAKDPWKDNVKLRQAVSWAKDRQGLLDAVYFGYGVPMTGGIIPSWSWGFADITYYDPGPNIEKAKALMTEAGFPNGLETTMKVSSAYPALVGEAEMHQATLKEIGINAKIIQLEWGTFIDEVFGKKDFDMQVCGWGGPFFDPDEFLYQEFHSDQGWNPQSLSDPDLDKLLEDGRNTFDQDKRKAIYKQAEQKIIDLAPLAAGVNSPFLQAHWDYLKGYKFAPSGMLKGFREAWLDKA